jgi:hypothetical protein
MDSLDATKQANPLAHIPAQDQQPIAGDDQLVLASKVDDLVDNFDFLDTLSAYDERENEEQIVVTEVEKVSENVPAALKLEDIAYAFNDMQGNTILKRLIDLHKELTTEDLSNLDKLALFMAELKGDNVRVPAHTQLQKGSKILLQKTDGQYEQKTVDHLTDEQEKALRAAIDHFISHLIANEQKAEQEKEAPEEKVKLAPAPEKGHTRTTKHAQEKDKDAVKSRVPVPLQIKERVIRQNTLAHNARAAKEAEQEKLSIFLDRLWLQLQKEIVKHDVSTQALKHDHTIFQIHQSQLKPK